jgi:hypothetical protein
MMSTLIRTPKGKTITPRRYVAIKRMLDANNPHHDQPCVHGHFGCAVWRRGPCVDEVLSTLVCRVPLSPAQVSAIECRDIAEDPESPGALAFKGDHLEFRLDDGPALADWLNEASNAEDAFAEDKAEDRGMRTFARRAAASLSAVFGKVLKETADARE